MEKSRVEELRFWVGHLMYAGGATWDPQKVHGPNLFIDMLTPQKQERFYFGTLRERREAWERDRERELAEEEAARKAAEN